MRLIQIVLPVHDEKDKAFPKKNYSRIEETLTKKFGGLTAYTAHPPTDFGRTSGMQPAMTIWSF